MKSQTNDTRNTQVVWDKCGRQIVLYEVISWKMKISLLHENQTLKWFLRKMKLTVSGWQKSEISKKLKEDIILNLFKWLKKLYESLFFERKNFIIECHVKHYFWDSHLEEFRNKNAPWLIRKFLRKQHAEKWRFALKSPKGCFLY